MRLNNADKIKKENAKHLAIGSNAKKVKWSGILTVHDPKELADAIKRGWAEKETSGWILKQISPTQIKMLPKPNLVVNSGVQNSLDLLFGLGGTEVITMGLDDGSSDPVAGTTSSTAGSSNRRLVAFDATPVRTSQQVSCLGTFTQANVTWNSTDKRLFLSEASAGTTDSAGDLYAMTNSFEFNLFTFTTWSQTFEALVDGTGS